MKSDFSIIEQAIVLVPEFENVAVKQNPFKSTKTSITSKNENLFFSLQIYKKRL